MQLRFAIISKPRSLATNRVLPSVSFQLSEITGRRSRNEKFTAYTNQSSDNESR